MISLPDGVKKILLEDYNQKVRKPINTINLPCTQHHKWKEEVRVEIFDPRDQKVTCPVCGRQHYFVYSKMQKHKYAE